MSLLDRIDTTRSTGPDKRPSTEPSTGPSTGPQPGPQPHDGVTVHRRRGALALVGTGALAVAVAYAVRATTGGDPLSYLVSAVLLPVAVLHLGSWWDASTPLLVADQTGVRLRDGRRWIGLRWDDTASVRLTPSRLPRRDGRLLVVGGDGVHHRLPLALVDPTDLRELPDALRVLAGSRTDVAVDERAPQTPVQSADPARAADP
ncbi:MAG: hypothetical protein H0U77_13395, partial [Nocardioidaceae bacterium]|nr:hypothetical protein [Nocardioidaceae bacterium]